jgi:hypothetical protein
MAKLLRILTVLIFLASIAALVLGIMLFNQRELLKGRTQVLETAIRRLAPAIEDGTAETGSPVLARRDIDDISDEILASPERSDFWSGYRVALEQELSAGVIIDTDVLMRYYKRDPVTERVVRDPRTGRCVTRGDEDYPTMVNLLDDLVDKAHAQRDRAAASRRQLVAVRGELTDTIEELNARKHALRTRLREITALNGRIDGLNNRIAALNGNIKELEDRNQQLVITIEDRDNDIKNLNVTVAEKQERIDYLKTLVDPDKINAPPPYTAPGTKGSVVTANPAWGFAVLKLDKDFIQAVLRRREAEGGKPYNVKVWAKRYRQGAGREYVVGRLSVTSIDRDKQLAVASIMPAWSQDDIRPGDTVFWQ